METKFNYFKHIIRDNNSGIVFINYVIAYHKMKRPLYKIN